ncbi:DUF1574 domain-containing protein [Microcoleus sp. FACHB-68]|uniref:DUF1574 domain-containing protein n=1 Tax=Microcoleus sp. FACHB-68 TaxID=2692826 RepID=UPI001F551531|nr:DUF1574 domain-containing protein [Microcoleus sp. FACHB-68]
MTTLMLNVDERVGVGSGPTLAEWASSALGLPDVRVQVRLRGNNLYLLCEGSPCPDVAIAVTRFAQALAHNSLETLSPPEQPRIYQVFLSGREVGHNRPDWTVRLDPTQLDRHLEPASPSKVPQPEPPTLTPAQPTFSTVPVAVPPAAEKRGIVAAVQPLSVSVPQRLIQAPSSPESLANQHLARSGNPDAIARYLSETLSALGVAVKVSARDIQDAGAAEASEGHNRGNASAQNTKRLWVCCESAYSPDPSLLAEPIAQRLRNLLEKREGISLQGFRDAVIVGQVSGEARPEWMLRVDMTPPEEMLKAWACWGDVQAIALLIDRALANQGIAVRAVLKEATLHLFCSRQPSRAGSTQNAGESAAEASGSTPDKRQCVAAIKPVLESIAPQGIQAATIYGVDSSQSLNPQCAVSPKTQGLGLSAEETPVWIDWVNLAATQHPALAESALDLAKRGDRGALTFVLDRLIHPNLNAKLATGGIHLSILHKDDLLHVISDAPVCPPQSRVGPPIAKLLRQLQIPEISGVRVYGRRAGQKKPLWRYGADFVGRYGAAPEAAPEFAASVAEGAELLPQPGDLVLRPAFKPSEEKAGLAGMGQGIGHVLQQLLIRAQLFSPSNQLANQATPHGAWVALVWGTLGLLLALQADWVMGQLVRDTKLSPVREAQLNQVFQEALSKKPVADEEGKVPTRVSLDLPQVSLPKSRKDDQSVFNVSGFTQRGSEQLTIAGKCQVDAGGLDPERCILESLSYPSFNSRQLDEHLLRYQQYLADSGTPDILIVGSSRALRGIDPAALQKTLAAQGYPNVKIFNFGINGATAQTVDVLIRQILRPDQLPKMILWADGARAFNSGRVDVTYNAIVASEGYKQLAAGKHPISNADGETGSSASNSAAPALDAASQAYDKFWTSSYDEMSEWFSQKLATVSATYPQRDRLKRLVQQQLATNLKLQGVTRQPLVASTKGADSPETTGADEMHSVGTIDANGFMHLPVRFNPAIYYLKHPKVPGNYDADYESFQLTGRQTSALRNLVQFTQSRDITLAFVNLPLTEDYLDPIRNAYEQEFQQQMLRLSMEEKFIFRDLSGLWPTQNEHFSDPSHLNRFGAHEVSQRVAKDPMIPWPMPNEELRIQN